MLLTKFGMKFRHVFRFGDWEIVPLVEEVDQLLDLPSNSLVITPRSPTRISGDLSTILCLPENLCDNYLQYGEGTFP